ncbi:chromatin structure-remodeling complex subunit SFH1 [Pseudohyphozyma bogoriensis]|nr:chromatin structure-remodeling complex subunit SFH1 [Pseudohyphozyma bogoriensis]
MQTQPTLQQQIDALKPHYPNDQEGLRRAVESLIARDHAQRQALGGAIPSYPPHPSTPGPSTPGPSTSAAGGGTATPTVSSRGRVIKPTKPFITPIAAPRPTPPPATLPPPTAHPRPSSLNPNAPPRPPARFPLSTATNDAPVPPLSRIAHPRYQSLYSTYPARLRLGTSSLMQPNSFASSSSGPSSQPTATGKRSRTTINYAELEMAQMEDSEDDGNDSATKRAMLGKKAAAGGGQWGDGKSYLGVLPPGRMVVVQAVKPTKHVAFSEDQLEEAAEKPAILVPISIELDVETFKIRDSFVWNLNEKLITPTSFARIFCDDLDIPATFAVEVAKQITDQIVEQSGVAEVQVRDEDEERDDVEKDLRVVLNLDVQIGTLHLQDRIEWDLSSPLTPELFALTLCRDLSLSSSALPLITHAIQSELFRHKKNCLEMGLVGGDQGKGKKGAKMLEGVWRDWNDGLNFGPRVEVLSLDEMDRVEADRERAIRRAKRDRMTGSRATGRRR